MPDLYTVGYFLPEQLRFLVFLTRWFRRILAGNRGLSPDQLSQANTILDVLEGWMPFDAGTGHLRLEVYKFGRLEIHVRPGSIEIRFWAWHPLASAMRPCDVFFTSGTYTRLADTTVQYCVRSLLERADRRPGPDFLGDGRLEIKWQWKQLPAPSPAPRWVALREQAWKQGGQPPRAIHWMADPL